MIRKKAIPTWEYKYLLEDQQDMAFLRDCQLIFDALLFYIVQPGLSDQDREEIRKAMEMLAKTGDQ